MNILNKNPVQPQNRNVEVNVPMNEIFQRGLTDKIVDQLLDRNRIDLIGQIRHDEQVLLSVIYTHADKFSLPLMGKIADRYMGLSLSLDRRSRKEIIDALAGVAKKKNFGERLKNLIKPEGE